MQRRELWQLTIMVICSLLAIATIFSACTSPLSPTAPPMPTATETPVPTSPPGATPTATPLIPPPGMALFRGITLYNPTRRFALMYSPEIWQMDRKWGWFVHRATGCTFEPEASGMGLEMEWTCSRDQITMGNLDFDRLTCIHIGQTVPGIVSYALTVGGDDFLFTICAANLDEDAFNRCRADAEAVLATFTPLEPLTGEFAASRSTLDVYEPPLRLDRVAWALARDVARWLSQGHNPADLTALLRTLPKLDAVEPKVIQLDLNGDGRRDVVVQPNLMGLPIIACVAHWGVVEFACIPLPGNFPEPTPTVDSNLSLQELTGDSLPEIIITYTVPGGSMSTELLYIFRCVYPGDCPQAFHARLITWAGPSSWALEPDPTQPGWQQIVLAYPHMWLENGFDHKTLNHPLGRQVWRWNAEVGRFVLAEETIDLEQSSWGPEAMITTEDRLRWYVNGGEAAFRAGDYGTALEWYNRALAGANAENWTPQPHQPDWRAYARFRRAETLALLGRPAEALPEMRAVAADYADDILGDLATAFLDGYGDGTARDAPARGVAGMQKVDARLYTYFYNENCAVLCFPIHAAGLLYPGAGLGAYLDAHPELVGDAGKLLQALQEVGFAAEDVRFEDAGGTPNAIAVITLRLPDAPNAGRALVEWKLTRSDGRWKVAPSPVPEWPTVGGSGSHSDR